MTQVMPGQVWVATARNIEGRTIRIQDVLNGYVAYTVVAPATYRQKTNPRGRIKVASLVAAYELKGEQGDLTTKPPVIQVDMTHGRARANYLEVLTDAGVVRVSVNQEDTRTGQAAVVVEVERNYEGVGIVKTEPGGDWEVTVADGTRTLRPTVRLKKLRP